MTLVVAQQFVSAPSSLSYSALYTSLMYENGYCLCIWVTRGGLLSCSSCFTFLTLPLCELYSCNLRGQSGNDGSCVLPGGTWRRTRLWVTLHSVLLPPRGASGQSSRAQQPRGVCGAEERVHSLCQVPILLISIVLVSLRQVVAVQQRWSNAYQSLSEEHTVVSPMRTWSVRRSWNSWRAYRETACRMWTSRTTSQATTVPSNWPTAGTRSGSWRRTESRSRGFWTSHSCQTSMKKSFLIYYNQHNYISIIIYISERCPNSVEQSVVAQPVILAQGEKRKKHSGCSSSISPPDGANKPKDASLFWSF